MRLALWATIFAGGVVIGVATKLPLWLLATGVTLSLVVAWRLRAVNLAMNAVVCSIGVLLAHQEVGRATAEATFIENTEQVVRGEVLAGADVADSAASDIGGGRSEAKGGRCHLRIRADQIGTSTADHRLSVLVLDGVPAAAPGDVVEFRSRLLAPRGFANPDLPDARLLARAQGIDGLAAVRSADAIRVLSRRAGPLSTARRWAFRLRQAMAATINGSTRGPEAAFIRTMVLGERSNVPTEVEDGFRAAGATHVLSVSGLHLAVVVALVFHTLRRLFAVIPALALRVPPKVAASALSLPACAFYALLTGEAVATLRSAVMAAIVLLATLVNRPLCLAASIAAAGLVLLLHSPLSILDVSFQLSFASVIGLALFARWMLRRQSSTASSFPRRALAWLLRSLSASVAACLVTAPLVAHHFGEVTPAAPVGNLVLVPVVELVVLPCGLVGSLLALAHPWLGWLPLGLAALASRAALTAAQLFRALAPVLLVRYPTWTETALLVAGAALLLGGVISMSGRRRRWFGAAAVVGVIAIASVTGRDLLRRSCDGLRVTFLDVGQGDAALVEGPLGYVALVDGGGRYDDSFDTGARIVEPVLRTRGIVSLDLVVLSHPHPDHMNGLLRVLQRFHVHTLWTSGDDGRNPRYRDLLSVAAGRGVRVESPKEITAAGELVIRALGPRFEGRIGVPPGLGANDASLVLQLIFAGRRILFTGDIGSEGEAELFEDGNVVAALPSDVMKVPHHGSRYASSERLLTAVSPTFAVASAGRFNRFGLPNPAAIDRYVRNGIPFLSTDRSGAVGVTIDRAGEIAIRCALGCQARPALPP